MKRRVPRIFSSWGGRLLWGHVGTDSRRRKASHRICVKRRFNRRPNSIHAWHSWHSQCFRTDYYLSQTDNIGGYGEGVSENPPHGTNTLPCARAKKCRFETVCWCLTWRVGHERQTNTCSLSFLDRSTPNQAHDAPLINKSQGDPRYFSSCRGEWSSWIYSFRTLR